MADKSKSVVLRPKVRFSQSAVSPNSKEGARAFTKPKIRSIVDLKGPAIRILKAPVANFDRACDSAEINLKNAAGDAPNDLDLCPAKSVVNSAPCLTEITLTPENRTQRTKNVFDKSETSKSVETQIAPSKSCLKENDAAKKVSSVENSHSDSVRNARKSCSSLADDTRRLRQIENRTRSSSQNRVSSIKIGKENVCKAGESREHFPRVPENTPRSKSDSDGKSSLNSRSKNIEASNETKEVSSKSKEATSKTKEALSKTKEAALAKKAIKSSALTLRKSTKEIGLMPCMKNAKSRSKSVPIKKTIIRDASSGPSNVYVGPGIERSKSPVVEIRGKTRSKSEIASGDKLARPEYNSIVGTMKKLLDLREERVIKDLKHLPEVYRGLVNGKVSSALDFGANEAIYRDLVDLSIDEKQLPSRLTRSKDPAPRQKDLVPKLSDFFVPTNNEEYRKAVLPRPPSPRVLDIWNPYKISDRIFAWKESLDHDL